MNFHLIGTVAEEWCCESVTIFLDYHLGIISGITANVLSILKYQKPEIGPGMNRHCAQISLGLASFGIQKTRASRPKGVASLLASTNGRHTSFLLCFLLGMESFHSLCRFVRGYIYISFAVLIQKKL